MINRNYAASPNQQPSNTLLESTMATNQQLVAAGKENVAANIDIFERINKEEQSIAEYQQKYANALGELEARGNYSGQVMTAKDELMQNYLNAVKEASGRNAFNPNAKAKISAAQQAISAFISSVKAANDSVTEYAKEAKDADPSWNTEAFAAASAWESAITSGDIRLNSKGMAVDKSGNILGTFAEVASKYHPPMVKGRDYDKIIDGLMNVKDADWGAGKATNYAYDNNKLNIEYNLKPEQVRSGISSLKGLFKTDNVLWKKAALKNPLSELQPGKDYSEAQANDYAKLMADRDAARKTGNVEAANSLNDKITDMQMTFVAQKEYNNRTSYNKRTKLENKVKENQGGRNAAADEREQDSLFAARAISNFIKTGSVGALGVPQNMRVDGGLQVYRLIGRGSKPGTIKVAAAQPSEINFSTGTFQLRPGAKESTVEVSMSEYFDALSRGSGRPKAESILVQQNLRGMLTAGEYAAVTGVSSNQSGGTGSTTNSTPPRASKTGGRK